MPEQVSGLEMASVCVGGQHMCTEEAWPVKWGWPGQKREAGGMESWEVSGFLKDRQALGSLGFL